MIPSLLFNLSHFFLLHHFLPARQMIAPGNKARAPFKRQIRPRPLDHHQYAVAESDKKKDGDEQPRQPRQKAGNMNLPKIGDGRGSTDRRERAFVPVVEVLSRFTLQVASDISGGSPAFLDSDWGQAWNPLAMLIFQGSQIPNYEHFGMSRNAEIGIHQHAPGAIYRSSQLF